MNTLRNIAYAGALTLASTSPLLAQETTQEVPKEATPEAIIEAVNKTVEAEAPKTPPMDPAVMKNSMSHGLGYQNGEQFAAYGFVADDFNKEEYLKGLLSALSGEDFSQDSQTYEQAMTSFQKIMTDREIALAKANQEAEKAFMEKNGKREGVITTESKLQYEILTKGTGKTYTAPPAVEGHAGMQMPDQTTEFLINCKGSLLDGTVVMETPEDEAIPFDLSVLPGIAEALQIMPVGSKWKLFVPSSLAFGERRQGPKVAPGSMLIYELELTEIRKKAAPQMPNFPQMPQPIVPR